MASSIRRQAGMILGKLERKREYNWFSMPVDPVKHNAPGYFDVVKEPMDFGTIKRKLENRTYCQSAKRETFNHISHLNVHFVVKNTTRRTTHSISYSLLTLNITTRIRILNKTTQIRILNSRFALEHIALEHRYERISESGR